MLHTLMRKLSQSWCSKFNVFIKNVSIDMSFVIVLVVQIMFFVLLYVIFIVAFLRFILCFVV